MRISAATHFHHSRKVCVYTLLAVYTMAVLVLVWLNWDWLAAKSWVTKIVLGVAVLFIGCSQFGIVMIFSGLLMEVFRELTCAQCAKCGGPTWYEEQQRSSKGHVVYLCSKCSFRETLKSTYLDEIPHGDPGGVSSGGAGGGG
jgi:hypothetical protein